MSETASCRETLAPFCTGNGADLGFGGDPIVPAAICIDRDESAHRAHVGNHPTHIVWDLNKRLPFRVGVLDYIYSSHVLEDFDDTVGVLAEWLRVIKTSGNLVLFLPDQKAYEANCIAAGQLPNQDHKHKDFSLAYILDCLVKTKVMFTVLHQQDAPTPTNTYSFELVIRKL